ncbi:hypothetical protein DPMN_057913 [Dreissena polymorpha]|uniref:Uncharacterized protein n=1 Tax=Dreissena polymorpha TaxID=45954 RepID=A0A9D4C146_DREPO|nr:hypothetical protein DPMN_057913 [Dreissena polymorpha]
MVVERLSEIAPDNADMVKGLSHSLNTAISKKDDVTKETQVGNFSLVLAWEYKEFVSCH